MQTRGSSTGPLNTATDEPLPNKSESAVAEPPARAERASKPAPAKVDQLPLFKVLLHNDDVNDMEDVVRALVTLTPHDIQTAKRLTLEAHMSGIALVLVTHKERAELYEDQFRSMLLTVTIEPD